MNLPPLSSADEDTLVRFSIIEHGGGLSVAAPLDMLDAVTAALASFPQSVEAHLRALDALYWGAAHLMVSALIEHDRQELLWRQGYRAPPPLDPLIDTWAIIDGVSAQRARLPARQGLVWIDLEGCVIRYMLPPPGIIAYGEIPIFDGQQRLARTVTYDLRGGWHVIALAPSLLAYHHQ